MKPNKEDEELKECTFKPKTIGTADDSKKRSKNEFIDDQLITYKKKKEEKLKKIQ